MMVMNKQVLPTGIEEYSQVHEKYRQALGWKVNAQIDQITKVRATVQSREKVTTEAKSPSNLAGEIAQ